MPTCLPQDDNSPARRARRLRRRQAKVRYNYAHIAGLGISSGVPLDHAPSWAWWKKVLSTAEQLTGNLKALSHREGTTPNLTLQSMMEITALRVEVESEGVDDQIEHEHDPDDLLDVAPTSGAGLGEDTRHLRR